MSTYIHQRPVFQENVTIDIDSGITVQKCAFLNHKNIYWGTFKGNISSDIMNAQISAIAKAYADEVEMRMQQKIDDLKSVFIEKLKDIEVGISLLDDVNFALEQIRDTLADISNDNEPTEPDDNDEPGDSEQSCNVCQGDDFCNGECPDPAHCTCHTDPEQ